MLMPKPYRPTSRTGFESLFQKIEFFLLRSVIAAEAGFARKTFLCYPTLGDRHLRDRTLRNPVFAQVLLICAANRLQKEFLAK